MSGETFSVDNTNFFAIEFSTNGDFAKYKELDGLTKPITPKDLIFRDMAVTGLKELAKKLNIVIMILHSLYELLFGIST